METQPASVVTGAFGYIGRYITKRLLTREPVVLTLTSRSAQESPFGSCVRSAPFDFHRPDRLLDTLRGARTLYNTYWVRFAHQSTSFVRAVDNTRTLIRAATRAGVQRVVHISITHPSLSSSLPYFAGKAEVEQVIRESGLSYSILRPTVVFGAEDILINNIAWCLRRFPVFFVPGRGNYRVQPVFVEDLARIAVADAALHENVVRDVVGPETFTFLELVRLIRDSIGKKGVITGAPRWFSLSAARLIGLMTRDVVLTRDELDGLCSNLLVSDAPPLGHTRLSEWLSDNADELGRTYASELDRHYRNGRKRETRNG